ncbi:MAG: FAD-dependent oxidoreductase [Planctomycetota bacterium]|nr:FAD-dependent oxidoreductase [Planctomycetota bacterium]
MSGKVVIVGGGIIGVSSAWYLSRAGCEVTVLDRAKIGQACSGGNCGLVCPSHVLPLTEPGAFKSAIQAMLSRGSPFRIQPRLDPALWSWLWRFARRCNHNSMVQAAHAIQAMLTSAMSEYERWVGEEKVECEWQKKGLLFTYQNHQPWKDYSETNDLLSEHFGEPARQLSAEESVEIEPALKSSVAGSWYYEHDAHLRPDKLIASLRSQLESDGVEFLEDCEFQQVTGSGSIAANIQTSQGLLSADQFLFASGAWTPLLKEHLGCRVPIEPGKGYSITMPRPQICPDIPIIFPEHRVAVTPMQSGYRLGSIMEFAGYDESIKPERLNLLREGAEHYLQEPHCEPELTTWFGWRPMTYDSVPVMDVSPRWGNTWIASGHNMLGLSMAPSTGKLISELMLGKTPHLDPEPYALKRFG